MIKVEKEFVNAILDNIEDKVLMYPGLEFQVQMLLEIERINYYREVKIFEDSIVGNEPYEFIADRYGVDTETIEDIVQSETQRINDMLKHGKSCLPKYEGAFVFDDETEFLATLAGVSVRTVDEDIQVLGLKPSITSALINQGVDTVSRLAYGVYNVHNWWEDIPGIAIKRAKQIEAVLKDFLDTY